MQIIGNSHFELATLATHYNSETVPNQYCLNCREYLAESNTTLDNLTLSAKEELFNGFLEEREHFNEAFRGFYFN